jgi:hypothetical protein
MERGDAAEARRRIVEHVRSAGDLVTLRFEEAAVGERSEG